jgi:hypothetical protein
LYEEKFIAFIDILGFSSLVEDSQNNIELSQKIFDAISSLHPTNIEKTAYYSFNYSRVPAEEVEEVELIHAQMIEAMKKINPVSMTYFSDCVVISAPVSSVIAS